MAQPPDILARQLAYAGDVGGAVAALAESLAENAAQPRLWLLLGDLLAEPIQRYSKEANPSGLGTRDGDSFGEPRNIVAAAEAYTEAVRRSISSDGGIAEAARENLQRLLRRSLGHSPAVIAEALWDTDRSRFIVQELRRATAAVKKQRQEQQIAGTVVACVIDGVGWEASWLARHGPELGVGSVVAVRGQRTRVLAFWERALADANGGAGTAPVTCCAWPDLHAHLEVARASALVVVFGSCLGAYPLPPDAVLADVLQLRAATSGLPLQATGQATEEEFEQRAVSKVVPVGFVPARVHWRGATSDDPLLQGLASVDVAQLQDIGLDYSIAAAEMRPRHAWVSLGSAGVCAECMELASLSFEEAWLCDPGAAQPEGAIQFAERTPEAWREKITSAVPSVVWWTEAAGLGGVGSSMVSCAPKSSSRRTWQVAVFGESLITETPRSLLAALSTKERFRAYHVGMLNDRLRNTCYDAAIQEAVQQWQADENLVAIDLGAGTGLLSLLVAKHYAKASEAGDAAGDHRGSARVVAIEAESDLAGLARRLAAGQPSSFGDIVEIHEGLSTRFGPGVPSRIVCQEAGRSAERAGLCVHEVFGSDPLSERMLPTLRHAMAELLMPNCRLVPEKFTLLCALCCGQGLLGRLLQVPASVEGVRSVGEVFAELPPIVDVLRVAAPSASSEIGASGHDEEAEIQWLTPSAEVATFDLRTLPAEVPLQRTVQLRGPGREAPLCGIYVAFWFRIEGPRPLDTGAFVGGPACPWAPVFQLLAPSASSVFEAPFVVDVEAQLKDDRVRFRLLHAALEDEDAGDLAPLFSDEEF